MQVVPSQARSLEWHMETESREAASKELVFIVEDADEGGYTAKALGASIFTEADTIDLLREQIRDAVRCHFDESTILKLGHAFQGATDFHQTVPSLAI